MEKNNALFGKSNLVWMLAGVIIIIVGLLLMTGGKTSDPAVFDEKEVYGTTRITLAPLLIMTGLLIEVFAIMKKGKG